LIIEGFKSIFEEAHSLCKSNNETEKYLMTFQNFISRIPKWNPNIIETERKRICDKSGCVYLEDLITCVHIIQLKLLTAMRVGTKQKKVDIKIPKLDDFIHKSYIHVARKIYQNVYLFEIGIPPLQMQKNHREMEIIIQECILNSVRESIPIESILRAYMDETIEEEVIEEIKQEIIDVPLDTVVEEKNAAALIAATAIASPNVLETEPYGKLKFNDVDLTIDTNKVEQPVFAPKTIERLEEISSMRNEQRKLESGDDDDDDDVPKLSISSENIVLGELDIHNIEEPKLNIIPDLLIDDIEVL
jgi:hypothetical protein